jgi:predicted GNAT family acetyltransferase
MHLQSDASRLPRLEPMGTGGATSRPFMEPHPLPVPGERAGDEVVLRMVSGDELAGMDGISSGLRDELMRLALIGKLAATFVNGTAVSFCDAGSETETLWDIGIETLEPYRGRGYAALAASYMVDQMGRRRKRPVWAAEESNVASTRLAAKLGFRVVDRRYVLSRA